MHLSLVSERDNIAADELLFKPACVTLRGSEGQVVRRFQILVSAFAPEGAGKRGFAAYSMTIAPRLWFLDQTSGCRVYQNLTIADIITRMLDGGGVTRRDLRLYGPLQALVSLVRVLVGLEVGFAINPVLMRAEVPALVLGAGAEPARLGWNTWLPAPTAGIVPLTDAAEAIFEAEAVERAKADA